MSWGRDIREPEVTMIPGAPDGGLEPQLLAPGRREVRTRIEQRIPAYTPQWQSPRPDDAGMALVRAYEGLAEAVDERLNRIPRRVALDQFTLAGVQPLRARPATSVVAIQVGPRANAPVGLPAGTAFLAPGGATPVVIETLDGCQALPGRVASVAVLSDGWLVNDQPDALGGLQPFGPRPAAGAELWLGIESGAAPGARLSLSIELLAPLGRAAVGAIATSAPAAPALQRWEAITAAGGIELPVERDGTGGLAQGGVVHLRVDAEWAPTPLPARPLDKPLYWLRARLVTSSFSADRRLRRVSLNGVTARAAQSIRDEVAEPLERPVSGRASYRLSQIPVVPGTVELEVIDVLAPDDDDARSWREVDELATAGPDDRVFTLDAAAGVLTFGDGVAGRAVPDGYRNVIARVYVSGGGAAGLPAAGDTLAPRRSVPNLTGATVLSITTGAEAETADELSRRGSSEISSRRRAVAPADYAALALSTEGVDVARAHCLPARDPRAAGGDAAGVVGVIVVPRVAEADTPPLPDSEALRAVAEHLAREVGVVGAEVVAAAPRYRTIAVQAVLIARAGSDLPAVAAAARDEIDRWLHPLEHESGAGWPFGEPARWDVLTRALVQRVSSLSAVSQLSFRVGARRLAPCVDVAFEPDELPWPGSHQLEVIAEERVA